MQILFTLSMIAGLAGMYFFIIRPRLQARFVDLYADIDSFWGRLKARLYAFRSYVAGCVAALAIAVPEILQHVIGMDLSFLPDPWAGYVTSALSIALLLMRAFATTPHEEPPR